MPPRIPPAILPLTPRALTPQAVHVWRLSLLVSPETLASCRAVLSADERARAMRFHFPEHQRRYAVARGILRQLLVHYVGGKNAAEFRFTYGPAGKPELEGGGVHFNVAHSGEGALVAIAKEAVGVDLEQIRALEYEAVGRQVLEAEEVAMIAGAPAGQKADIFFRLWVRHEARQKAMGLGVGEPCPAIPVYDLEVGAGYCAALATRIEGPQIELLGERQ